MQAALTLVHVDASGPIWTGVIAVAADDLPLARVGSHRVDAVERGAAGLPLGATFINVETVAMCIPLKAHSTLGFRVASERALGIHTLKAGSTVMALLRTLVDVFTNVTVDPVTLGAADQPQAGVAPDRVHASLVQLAGTRRRALVYVFAGVSVSQEGESGEAGTLKPSAHRGALLLTWMVSFAEVERGGGLGGGRGRRRRGGLRRCSVILLQPVVLVRCLLCASEGVLLQHVAGEALAAEGALRVDTYVLADVALVYLALVHVLQLFRTLHCILTVLFLTNGEGLFGVRAVRYSLRRRGGGENWLLSDR